MLRAMVEDGLSLDNKKILWKSDKFRIGICQCGCKSEIALRTADGFLKRFKHGHNSVLEFSNNWKNGRAGHSEDYIMIKRKDHPFANKQGYVFEHRIVYEEYYKCCLLPWTLIHHKNIHNLSEEENKKDNTVENLEPITRSNHMTHHFKKDMSDRKCELCGSSTTSISKKKYPRWFRYKNGHICNKCDLREKAKNKKKRLGLCD